MTVNLAFQNDMTLNLSLSITTLAFLSYFNSEANLEISVFSISLARATSNDSNLTGPRYLRMETNAFHPSEMSLGSTNDLLLTSTSNLTTDDSSESIQEENKTRSKKTIPDAHDEEEGLYCCNF